MLESVDLDTIVGLLERRDGTLLDLGLRSVVDDDLNGRGFANNGGDRSEEVGVGEDTVDGWLIDRVFQLGSAASVATREE